MPTSARLVSAGRWWRAVAESIADEMRGAARSMRETAESGELPAWTAGVADWLERITNGQPTAGLPLKVARAYLEASRADDLRVRIHKHLAEHPGLSAWETAAALKTDGVTVRNLLYAMAEDGEAEADTTGPVTRWTAT